MFLVMPAPFNFDAATNTKNTPVPSSFLFPLLRTVVGMTENWAAHPRATARLLAPIRAKSSTERVMPINTITAASARVIKVSLRQE